MKIQIISAILVLALASMACGFSFDLPEQVKAGPEVKESIAVTDPQSDETRLSLSFGAGDLKLSPGAKNLVEGTVIYNVKDLKPEVFEDGAEITIKQGNFEGLPPFDGMKNEWDLKLGASPMDLTIEAGAYTGDFELGGLALNNLTVNDGAADVSLSFSEPNLVEMDEFTYTTGASDVTLEGLANANFERFIFNSGAGDYTLDFSGELQRDATVSIDSGLSDLRLVIPAGVHAVVTIDSALVDINIGEGWSQRGNTYTQSGDGPTLTIIINMGAGEITITD
ncbi:MAG: toast rack family protein [Chloroflexota bacterium]